MEYLESLEQPKQIRKIENKQPDTEIDLTELDITVLFAEDNPVNKFLTRTILSKVIPAAKIIEADNGEEAVNAFKDNAIDFILMDIQMPIMSGFEATTEIRKIERDTHRTPIIALTARAIKGERERCLKHDMDDYIAKPIVLDDLKKCLIRFLKVKNGTEQKVISPN